jgi:GNAT superfamily N-acetyltransferase
MTIQTAPIPSELLAEYADIPIRFEVTSTLSARRGADGLFALTEQRVDLPYIKDYDALGDQPLTWPGRYDTTHWILFLARAEGRGIAGATIALGTPGLDMLEDRSDLAILWDIRIAPGYRGRGVGRALLETAEAWASARGCRELKVETQNVNVPACRFYQAAGFELHVVLEDAYADCPGEAKYLWYKALAD